MPTSIKDLERATAAAPTDLLVVYSQEESKTVAVEWQNFVPADGQVVVTEFAVQLSEDNAEIIGPLDRHVRAPANMSVTSVSVRSFVGPDPVEEGVAAHQSFNVIAGGASLFATPITLSQNTPVVTRTATPGSTLLVNQDVRFVVTGEVPGVVGVSVLIRGVRL